MAAGLITKFGWRAREDARMGAHYRANHAGSFIVCAICWPAPVVELDKEQQ